MLHDKSPFPIRNIFYNRNKTQGFRVELQVSGGRGTRLGTRQGQDRDKTETSQRQVRGKTKKRKGQDKGGGG